MKLKFIKNTTLINFLSSTLFMYGITLLTGFVTYRYVAPDYLGIWAVFSTFTTIASILRLGIVNGMNRELPFYLGKGEKEKAMGFASTTLFYTLLSSGVLLLIGLVFVFFFDFESKGDYSNAYKFAAAVFFLKIIIEPYYNYLSGTFRTSDSFNKLSRIQYIIGILRLISIPLVIIYLYNGYLIRELIIEILSVLLLHLNRPLKGVKPSFDFTLFKGLFSIGFSVFMVSYVSYLVDSIPRLFIIKEGTAVDLGLYSPVLIILSTVLLIPSTISNYLYPKFSFAYGQGCSRAYLWAQMKKMMAGSVLVGLVCSVLVLLLIDKLMVLFPKYLNSAYYIKVVAFGMVFLAFKVANVICVVLKEYKWIWVMPILNIIFQIVSILIFYSFITDVLLVVSYSLVATYFLMFITSWLVIYKVTHKTENNNEVVS